MHATPASAAFARTDPLHSTTLQQSLRDGCALFPQAGGCRLRPLKPPKEASHGSGHTISSTLHRIVPGGVGKKLGTSVGNELGSIDGTVVGSELGMDVGSIDGSSDGTEDGLMLGMPDGVAVGSIVGARLGSLLTSVGWNVGPTDGTAVGGELGGSVGAVVGGVVGTIVGGADSQGLLQGLASVSSGHSLPPCPASSTHRVRCRVPGPQGSGAEEHGPHGCQMSTRQSTGHAVVPQGLGHAVKPSGSSFGLTRTRT